MLHAQEAQRKAANYCKAAKRALQQTQKLHEQITGHGNSMAAEAVLRAKAENYAPRYKADGTILEEATKAPPESNYVETEVPSLTEDYNPPCQYMSSQASDFDGSYAPARKRRV